MCKLLKLCKNNCNCHFIIAIYESSVFLNIRAIRRKPSIQELPLSAWSWVCLELGFRGPIKYKILTTAPPHFMMGDLGYPQSICSTVHVDVVEGLITMLS